MHQDVSQVRVGDTVYFYHEGNPSGTPLAGLVLEKFGGMLTLCVRSGGNWHDKTRVQHKDSEVLKTNKDMAVKLGCWECRPTVPPVKSTVDQAPSAKTGK